MITFPHPECDIKVYPCPDTNHQESMSSEFEIPKVQKAVVVAERDPSNEDFKLKVVDDYPVPELDEDEVLVRLTSSGVCQSDLSFILGKWGVPMTTQIGGHEGSGYVVKLGSKVDSTKYNPGMRVGVPLVYNPCGDCEACNVPESEMHCTSSPYVGQLKDGTWQQYTKVKSSYICRVPDGPDESIVGPILCGGVTVYKALKNTQCRAGQWVVITGAGGGLGCMATEFAVAMGLRVVAIDTGEEKEKKCKELGAEVFVDYIKQAEETVESIVKATQGGAHGCILIAPNTASFNQCPAYMRLNGNISLVGLPKAGENMEIPPILFCFKKLSITGGLVGTRQDISEALDFVARGKVTPPVKVYPMEETEDILRRMMKGEITGRAVINLE